MKIAIVLCALFAFALAARPVPVHLRERPMPAKSSIRYPGGILKRDSNRIIGGYNDKKDAHKYQISLQKLPSGGSWYHTCGGSIISSTRILTAAHCIDSGSASVFRVIAGEYELYKTEGTEQTIGASRLVFHPQWDEANINNDVGVVHLSKAISLNSHAATIRLAGSVPAHGAASTVTGWGYTNYQAQTRPTILQVLETTSYVSESDWWGTTTPGSFSSIWNANTQVATRDSNQGICMGDSGGPLVNDATGEQYGVCSYVLTPCGQDKPDYYASVPYFRSWINSN